MNLWKLSAGTASVIGKRVIKSDTAPTTAYIMLGENAAIIAGFVPRPEKVRLRTVFCHGLPGLNIRTRKRLMGYCLPITAAK